MEKIELMLSPAAVLELQVVLAAQLALVLVLRHAVRRWLGAQVAYRLWTLVPLWLLFYSGGQTLLMNIVAGIKALWPAVTQNSATGNGLPLTEQQLWSPTWLVWQSNTALSGMAERWAPIFLLLWGVGAALLVLWQGWRLQKFARWVNQIAQPLDQDARQYCGVALHVDPAVSVCWLHGLGSAAVYGLRRPQLLLPSNFLQRYDADQRHIILAHEAVHLQRKDNLWNFAASLLLHCSG
jgi:bla regulator protein blaR1